MKYEMIVARYKEDINWISNLNINNLTTTIYNKYYNEVNLLNNETGREAHTYFHHICENYENLADFNIFTQANPFDHSPNFIEEVKNIVVNKLEPNFMPLTNYHGEKSIFCDLDGKPHHPSLNLQIGMNIIFPNLQIKQFEFYPGAIFIVSKSNILNRPKTFYKKCLELSKDQNWRDSYGKYCCGYFFERTWKYIFERELK